MTCALPSTVMLEGRKLKIFKIVHVDSLQKDTGMLGFESMHAER